MLQGELNMKKLLGVLICLVYCICIFVSSALADTNRVEISFRVGDEILKINGSDIKVVKPFVVKGTTLVPLRVITEAFGAGVQWNPNERSVTLTYCDTTIKVFIDKKDAFVDGNSTTLLEAPVIIANTTMVPLRFITENFGADVQYDPGTSRITVIKSVYENKKLGWSVNLLPEWIEQEDSSSNSKVLFKGTDDTSFYVKVYHKEKGVTLDKWIGSEENSIEEGYNADIVNVLDIKDGIVKGIKIKKLYTQIDVNEENEYTCTTYMVGAKYRYELGYRVGADIYENEEKKLRVEKVIDSFRFTQPDASASEFIDTYVPGDSAEVKLLENEEYKWSMELPETWSALDGNNNADKVLYWNYDKSIVLQMTVSDESDNKTFLKKHEKDLKASHSNFKLQSSETIDYKGTVVETAVYTYGTKAGSIAENAYVLSKNGYTYFVAFMLPDFKNTVKNENMLDAIWESMNFGEDAISGNSIKDYAAILKKTTMEKIGDSYHKWSINLPRNLRFEYRNFNGTTNVFVSDDGAYFIRISISEHQDETMQSILADGIGYAKQFTLIKSGIQKINGIEYAGLVYRDSEYTYEDRTYISNGKVYYLELYMKDYNKYKGNSELQALLNSFVTKFSADGKTEDLSDVTPEGFRTFKNRNLGWTVNVKPDWYAADNRDKENTVSFGRFNDPSSLYVNMYSLDEGATLNSITEEEVKKIKDEYNAKYVQILDIKEDKINGVKCKKIYVKIDINGESIYVCDVYMVGENYRYYIGYYTIAEVYNDAKKRAELENMVSSFTFSEPDADEIGQLIDPDSILVEGIKKVTNKANGYNFEVPVTWKEAYTSDELIIYNSGNYSMDVSIFTSKEFSSLSDFDTRFSNQLKESHGNNAVVNKEVLSEKDTQVIKYTLNYKVDNAEVVETVYILYKNGKIYMMVFSLSDLRNTEKNREIGKKIWESFKIS